MQDLNLRTKFIYYVKRQRFARQTHALGAGLFSEQPHILRLCLKSRLNGFIKIDLQLRELYARSYIEYSKFLVFTALHVLHKAHEQII